MSNHLETTTGTPENSEKKGFIESGLSELGQKVQVAKYVWEEMGNLYDDFNKMTLEETWDRFKGVFAMGFLGMLMSKEEFDEWTQDREDIHVEQQSNRYEVDKNPLKRQLFVNMKAIKYFDTETKKPFEKPQGRIGKMLSEKKVKPSKFILGGSSELFKEGITDYDGFKKNVTDKLVDESVTDQKERERQAAIILSCCAIGHFQIVPRANFGKMGWSTEGESGLRDMYEFIRSTERQVDLYKKIITNLWDKYKDPGHVGVSYYSGSAEKYRKNPMDPKFHKTQYGGHISIHGYAEKIRRLYKENKREFPTATDIDCVAMAIEKVESGGSIIRNSIINGSGFKA